MPSDDFDNWMVQVRKGVLELCVLSALVERERYGLDLIRELTGVPGLGVKEGTLYPLLSRLRVQGLVRTRLEESSEGPARKYYALTRDGRRMADQMTEYLESLLDGIRRVRRGEEKR
jgi:PadR family transcriptional regulator PadR